MNNAARHIAHTTREAKRAELGLRPKSNSRTADKFVLRSRGDVMGIMRALGDVNRRSANAEITTAIVESLTDRKRACAIRRSFVHQLGPIESAVVLSKVAIFAFEVEAREKRNAIRLPDGVRASITDAAELASAGGGVLITMNDWILDAVLWWINNQRECSALLDAIVAKDDLQGGTQ